jgi:hypothetical protein
VSFNLAPYDGASGPLFISGADSDVLGDVAHGRPGALYYTCRAP